MSSSSASVSFLVLLLSTGAVLAQADAEVLRVEPRPTQLRASISQPGKFFGVLVASRSGATFVNEYGFEQLVQWDVVGAGLAEHELKLTFQVGADVLQALDAHLQAFVWVDGVQHRVSPPFSVRKWLAENTMLPELKVDLTWPDAAGGPVRFRAVYTAPTDGYALGIAAIAYADGQVEVRLKLKTPGPGEGLRDVVETHTAEIDLNDAAKPGVTVLVLIGETDGTTPIKSFGVVRKLVVPPRDAGQVSVRPAKPAAVEEQSR